MGTLGSLIGLLPLRTLQGLRTSESEILGDLEGPVAAVVCQE